MSSSTDLCVVEDALKSFQETQTSLDKSFRSAVKRLESEFRSVDQCVEKHKGQLQEYQRISRMVRSIRGDVESENDKRRLEELENDLVTVKESLDGIRELKPRTHSAFLRFAMGKVNVKMWKKKDHMNFRDEYNKFKERTTYIFLLLPLIQLFVFSHPWLWVLHKVWILYYYLSLALRENILQANGSNIKDWWIVHHYITAMIMLLSLLMDYRDHEKELSYFLVLQGAVMLIQNRYQGKRHYVRISLNKAKDIDVNSTETIVEKPSELKLMIPLLFIVYLFELAFGVLVYTERPSTGHFVIGFLWIVLGLGNGITTATVLFQKHKKKVRSQRRLSTHKKK